MREPGHYFQHTLNQPISFVGPGLHSGQTVSLVIQPAPADTGRVFVRQDVPADRAEIPARWNAVTDTRLSTTVSNRFGVKIATIEHLMAALQASGVDNARMVLNGPEVPILDGSSAPFVRLIRQVGLCPQREERRVIVVRRPVRVEEQGKWAVMIPDAHPSMDMTIEFDSAVIGRQQLSIPLDRESFEGELADARTFGFQDQVDTLRALGLTRGGSLRNAVLVNEGGIVNPEGLRHPDEFVRHKILDAIGDLALAGAPIVGRIVGYRSGHALNNALLRELLQNEDNWILTTMRDAHNHLGWSGVVRMPGG
jgi:UDP-3-O-[3-hydroxymyristoyl] N-acetylglucosamine deacetylase